MLTSKQRAQLRAMANSYDTILQIGKGGITDQVIAQADTALEARELIKAQVLETAGLETREAANELAGRVNADVVQVIGRRFVMYREGKEKEEKKKKPARGRKIFNKKSAKDRQSAEKKPFGRQYKENRAGKPRENSKDKPVKSRTAKGIRRVNKHD